MEDSQHIFAYLNELFSHIWLVKAFGKEAIEGRRYIKKLIANMRMMIKSAKLEIGGVIFASITIYIVSKITNIADTKKVKEEFKQIRG